MHPRIARPDAYTGDPYDSLTARNLGPLPPADYALGLIVLPPSDPAAEEDLPLRPKRRRHGPMGLPPWTKPET